MRVSPFILGAATFILAAPGASPQTQCDTQTCTFTLSFGSAREGTVDSFRYVTGAPYSDQEVNESKRTLQDGTHTSSKTTGPLIYRDSKGRMRTEQSMYGRRSDSLPKSPDDFTVVEIHDPVAGFEYILDPVTHVAHRMAFKPGEPQEFTSAMLRSPGEPSSFTTRNGLTITEETLGPQAMFGAAAVGVRRTNTNPPGASGEHSVAGSTSETWLDPKTGIILLRKDGSPGGDGVTMTMLRYSNAEPDAALFQVPDGYKVVDETGPFKVIHTRTSPGGAVWNSAGPQKLRSSVDCEEESCILTFDLTSQRPMAVITGAPYSGREILEIAARTLPNGRQSAAITRTRGTTDRDSAGRIRTGKVPVNRVNGGQIPDDFGLVEIDDPVAGYQSILDTIDHVAYRVPWRPRLIAFQPGPRFQPPGTHTSPDGTVDVEEDLGEKTIDGVTASGRRSTQTSPPGTRQGNDKPITAVAEGWVDPNTGVTLLQTQSGSEGASTRSIPDYKAGDPDPSLFQIPSDYKVVDETGKFTFTISRERLNSQLR
jgi:hypothetical protein